VATTGLYETRLQRWTLNKPDMAPHPQRIPKLPLPDATFPTMQAGMRRDVVGTRAWVEATGGILRPNERLRFVAQWLLSGMYELPAELLGRMGWKESDLVTPAPAEPSAKQGAMNRAAAECSKMVPVFLRDHSHRSYLWALLLAAHARIPTAQIDEELLYVCCLLHDLGLSRNHPLLAGEKCFTMVGARFLRKIATNARWEEGRIRRGEEAITLHVNPRVLMSQGLEAYLLTRATQLDAIGVGTWRVSPENRREVFDRYKGSEDQKRGFSTLLDFAHHVPGSRARTYRYLGSRWWFYLDP
jgi:hypothetical protein